MDSGSELTFAKMMDSNNITWDKNTTKYYIYTYNGKSGKYYPDFYLEDYDLWVEIKGEYYVRDGDDARLASVGNIIKIMSKELRKEQDVLDNILISSIKFSMQEIIEIST